MTEDGSTTEELPEDIAEMARRLTRRARRADGERADELRARREASLAEYDFRARVREERDGDVLVCYPQEWLVDGEVVLERIEDQSRAVERPLEGPESDVDWDAVEAENRDVVETVRERHGDVHAENAAALADFMGNHHARRIAEATPAHLETFRTEYYPRNAFPDDDQRAVLETSLAYVFEIVDADPFDRDGHVVETE